MRKVLLRILFEDYWAAGSVGNEFHAGAGWMIMLWLLIAAIGLGVTRRKSTDWKEALELVPFWAVVPVLLLLLPLTSLPIVKDGLPIFGYGVMMFVGFSSATWLAARRAPLADVPSQKIWDMMMWALIPGLIGARGFYLIQYGDQVFRGASGIQILQRLVALWDGGIVFYGGVFGGFAGMAVYARRQGVAVLNMLDIVAPSLFVGSGFGRIGCFLYGCCYGGRCETGWAVHFPPDSLTFERLGALQQETGEQWLLVDGSATIGLHPAQLYSSALAFLLAGLLIWYFPRRIFMGSVIGLAALIYPVNRFLLELVRADESGQFGTGLTISQLISVMIFLGGVILMTWQGTIWYSERNREPQQPVSTS